MRLNEIEDKMRWFYTLELEQMDLYEVQSSSIKDDYIKRVLKHFVSIENGHFSSLTQQMDIFGFKPRKKLVAIFEYMGDFGGTITSMAGLKTVLQSNQLLEQRAFKEYNSFIEQLENSSIRDEKIAGLISVLKANAIEEEMHLLWCKGKTEEISGGDD